LDFDWTHASSSYSLSVLEILTENTMISFLTVVHLIACLGLAGLVLIQDSKGGGVFTSQGSSNSVLGATGATSLAETMTKVMAVLLAVTSITLSVMSSRGEKSVVDNMPVNAGAPAGATATAPVEAKKAETTAPPATNSTPGAVAAPAPSATPAAPAANETK
jgi:preprotein translocase subunit SecG